MDNNLEAELDEILKGAEGDKKMEQDDTVSNIFGRKVWDIPVGQALVGGFEAILASEIIDGMLAPNYRKWWFRFLLCIIRRLPKGISNRLLERFSHSTLRALAKLALAAQFQDNPVLFGSKAMSLLLAYDALMELGGLDGK